VISVILSGFVALTLTPALAALLLDGSHGHPPKILRKFNEWFDRLTESYTAGVRWVLKRATLAVAVFAAFLVAILGLFKTVPGSFVPPEDQGFMLIAAILPDSASLDRSDAVARRIAEIVMEHPATEFASVLTGYSLLDSQYKTNAATVFVSLRDFEERTDEAMSLDAVIASIQPKLAGIQDAIVIPLNPPPIPGLGAQGGFELWVQDLTGGDPRRLAQAVQQLVAGAKQDPTLAGVNSTFNPTSRQLSVKVDREKAETLGAPIADVYGSLQSLFGSLYVSQYNRYGRVWQVVLQAEPEFRSSPEDLRTIYVRGRSGEMVPLDAITTARFTTARTCSALQRLSRREDQRQPGARLQLRPGHRRDGGARRTAARGLRHRVVGAGLRGEAGRRRLGPGVRVRPDHGVPDPGGQYESWSLPAA